MFQKILCPIDLSDYSKPQIAYARVLAESQDAALGVLHVIPIAVGLFDPAAFAQIQNEWDLVSRKQVRELCGEDLQFHFTHGVIADEIAATAENESYDLIVMPTHGYRGLKKFFLGSNFQSVLAKTSLPVWCLSPHFLEENAGKFERPSAVVCPVEIADGSEDLVRTASSLAKEFDASLTILYSPEIPAELRNQWSQEGSFAMEIGHAFEDVHEWVVNRGMDLVVFGVRSGSSHRIQTALYRVITELRVPALCV